MKRWLWVALLCAACGGVEEGTAIEGDETIESGTPHPLGLQAGLSDEAAAKAKLTYYGGPVLEQASAVAVLWGDAVDPEVASRIGDFYQAVTGSSYFGWLSEYDTPSQHVGKGSSGGVFTIAPSRKSGSISDKQIEKELAAQIKKGALPRPDANTVYLIHFPSGATISMGGAHSCQSGGFCGYHSAFRSGKSHVRYAVLPDMGAGSGCDTGCGSGTAFERMTSVASHELVEATTDPDVGLAKGLASPLAWYDSTNGEIGDICAGKNGKLHARGTAWTVQKEWSNKAGACVLSGR
jgi:hypothetical protein